ncbi:glycosyltransferase family 2 protein [Sulfurimonas diazotrophicus]|uniref:Glycosyltransferase family 2 protein n=1 Tax=Sulfurimonas diazotrophicus TaxID=3131939 RepID=A0ABZ3HBS0_9BACT
MTFVIPMAGKGSRFQKAGYEMPKMLIEAHGKTLLEWSVDSLPLEICDSLIFIGLKEHKEKYSIDSVIKKLYADRVKKLEILFLDKVTRGQAETVMMGEEFFEPDKDLVIFNIDTHVYAPSLKYDLLREDCDGVLGAFHSNEDRFSFAKLDENGYVVETAEKVAISNYALTGLYHFKRASDFVDVAKKHIESEVLTKGEFYIAPMYNDLISEGKKFIINMAEEHWVLGTPEELNDFEINYQSRVR